jgi:hypothetical protein
MGHLSPDCLKIVLTDEGDIMKSALQRYEFNTRQMALAGSALIVVGVFVCFMWSGIGLWVAAIGLAGLIWCFLRR